MWDARLSSELILLFLYVGYIALGKATRDLRQGSSLQAMLAVIGLLDIPIVHYSVQWWQTLHQSSSFQTLSKPQIESAMLKPLLLMLAAFGTYYVTLLLLKLRQEVIKSHGSRRWIKQQFKEIYARYAPLCRLCMELLWYYIRFIIDTSRPCDSTRKKFEKESFGS